jgi:hypothetical protein
VIAVLVSVGTVYNMYKIKNNIIIYDSRARSCSGRIYLTPVIFVIKKQIRGTINTNN